MSPLEKMARAVMVYHGQNPDVTITWGGESVLEQREREVRAALQSLLPPDEGTVEAVFEACPWAPPGYNESVITAFVQHILKEDA